MATLFVYDLFADRLREGLSACSVHRPIREEDLLLIVGILVRRHEVLINMVWVNLFICIAS